MLNKILAIAVVASGLVAGSAPRALALEVAAYGGAPVVDGFLQPGEAVVDKELDPSVRIVPVGNGLGLVALVAGKADIAMISAPLKTLVEKLHIMGEYDIDTSDLTLHGVGNSRLAFMVHESNPVKSLTFREIALIFAGEITSWEQVGGADQEIEVVTLNKDAGKDVTAVERLETKRSTLNPEADPRVSTFVQKKVASNPRAIGITAQHLVTERVHVLDSDRVVEMPMILVTKGKPSQDVTEAIEAFRATFDRPAERQDLP